MRINSVQSLEMLNKYVYVRDKAMVAYTPPPAEYDKVELSENAQTFSALLKAVKEAGAARTPAETEKINDIARQIREGTYNRPGVSVADKMLEQ